MAGISKLKRFENKAAMDSENMDDKLLRTIVALEKQVNRLDVLHDTLLDLMEGIAKDNDKLKKSILTNVSNNIAPYIESLERSRLRERQSALIETLELNIDKLISPFAHRLSSEFADLTPMEIRVACQIRDGKTTKEMADLFCVSINTILTHRHNIRRKLGLTNKCTNLRSHLSLLDI